MFLTIAFFCLLGVFYGSFVGSYIIRFPKLIDAQSNVTIYSPRSRCEECGATLKYYMLIPLLSYLIQRGRCLFCKRSISKFYFLNELFHLSLMASILWSGALPSNLESILIFLVIVSLYAQFLIDLRHLALSLFFSGKILILGLILNGYFGLFTDIASSLMGAFAGYASLYLINKIYFLIRKREGIGGGDFILLASIGALLGFQLLSIVVLIASLIALLIYFLGREHYTNKVPFGSGLALSAILIAAIKLSVMY